MLANIPRVVLKPGKEKFLKTLHPWVFSGALQRDVEQAGLHRLETSNKEFAAWVLASPASSIALRILSRVEPEFPDSDWYARQILRAHETRRRSLPRDCDVYRLVFAESDGLAGFVVDRLGPYLVVQVETQGAEAEREVFVEAVTRLASKGELGEICGVWEKSDSDGRAVEGLSPREVLLWGEDSRQSFDVTEGGFKFRASLQGQKTGFYPDQRDNRAVVARFAKGCRVLDVCSYTGAFSVYAAHNEAAEITMIDSSRDSLDLAAHNLSANGWNGRLVQHCGDAFDTLRRLKGSTNFDLVILDPPKLASQKKHLERALAAYKDLNLQALALLSPGGILASFSCSGLVSEADLERAIAFAGVDAQRELRVLHRLSQGADHPVPLYFPEAQYLKGFVIHAK